MMLAIDGNPAARRRDVAGTITLITGDRATVSAGQHAVDVSPAAGRESIDIHVMTVGGDLAVIPADAAAFISSGVLDRQLFGVTALLADGFGDADRDDIPLIVQYDDLAHGRSVSLPGTEITRELWSINGLAISVRKAEASHTWRALSTEPPSFPGGIQKIWLDGVVRTMAVHNNPAGWLR